MFVPTHGGGRDGGEGETKIIKNKKQPKPFHLFRNMHFNTLNTQAGQESDCKQRNLEDYCDVKRCLVSRSCPTLL